MNIALVVHNFDAAEGTGGYAVHLANRFADEHDVTIYARHVNAPVPNGVHVVNVPAFAGRAYSTILSFPRAFEKVRGSHDVVHAQGWVAYDADVVTAHIVMGAWRSAARAARITPPLGERIFGRHVESQERKLIADRARAVIAPSAKAKGEIEHLYRRSRGVHLIPHGFPPIAAPRAAGVARKQLDIETTTFLALYVGDARKGLQRTLEALSLTTGIGLLVASHSDPARYLAQAKRLGVARRVHWLGPSRTMDIAYAAADVLVHPTIYDSFGLVVAEAMAHGTPVVTSTAAGISELIVDRSSGLIVEDDDPRALTNALDELAGDPDLRHRLAEGGRSVAAKRPWDEVARDTLRVYTGNR